MRVRLEDVARHAGASPEMMSCVLNDETIVSDTTRKRVLPTMDCRPLLSACSLAGNRLLLVAM